ncbi:MAG: cupin domain-containing protein [Candidatus Bathyarchaeia archaeon]|jgi:quercetin dioxygenase-like cupin family protein
MNQQVTVLKLEAVEGFDTIEGFMKPLSVNEHVSVIHTIIPQNLKAKPHAHKSNGVIFLLKGQLELISNDIRFTLTPGCVAIIPANIITGVNTPNSSAEVLMISAPPSCKSVEELKTRLQAASKRS